MTKKKSSAAKNTSNRRTASKRTSSGTSNARSGGQMSVATLRTHAKGHGYKLVKNTTTPKTASAGGT
jgi:hypothetical protein